MKKMLSISQYPADINWLLIDTDNAQLSYCYITSSVKTDDELLKTYQDRFSLLFGIPQTQVSKCLTINREKQSIFITFTPSPVGLARKVFLQFKEKYPLFIDKINANGDMKYCEEALDKSLRQEEEINQRRKLQDSPMLLKVTQHNVTEGKLTKALLDELEKKDQANIPLLTKLAKDPAIHCNERGANGWTMAHVAAKKNNWELMEVLVNQKADLTLKTTESQVSVLDMLSPEMRKKISNKSKKPTVIQEKALLAKPFKSTSEDAQNKLAVELDKDKPNMMCIKEWLKYDINLNTQGKKTGKTVAHLAAQVDDIELLKYLRIQSADFNLTTKDKGWSPLCFTKKIETVRELVQGGASLVLEDNQGKSAFETARNNAVLKLDYPQLLMAELDKRDKACPKTLMALLGKCRHADYQGHFTSWTALHVAVVTDNFDLVNYLLERKASTDYKTRSTLRTPIFYAKSTKMVERLLEVDSDLLTASDSSGMTAEAFLDEHQLYSPTAQLSKELGKSDCSCPMLIMLVNQGAQVNFQHASTGYTAAHQAALNDNLKLCKILTAKGASFNTFSRKNTLPLTLVKDLNMLEAVLKAGADPLMLIPPENKVAAYQKVLKNFPGKEKEAKKILLAHAIKKQDQSPAMQKLMIYCSARSVEGYRRRFLFSLKKWLQDEAQVPAAVLQQIDSMAMKRSITSKSFEPLIAQVTVILQNSKSKKVPNAGNHHGAFFKIIENDSHTIHDFITDQYLNNRGDTYREFLDSLITKSQASVLQSAMQ